MPDKVDHARGWFRKADSDLITVKRLLEGDGPYDTACFHAQQAIEKLLKGLLAYLEKPILLTHNLEELGHQCQQHVPQWPLEEIDLATLTPYAVQLRYDFDFWPDRETVEEALTLATQVQRSIYSLVPPTALP